VFDPNTKTGELAINASKGVLRVVGGKISKTGPIVITTPANTVGIRGGITILDIRTNQTDSVFVFGKDMRVTAAGITRIATRPGSEIVTMLGQIPGMPVILSQGALQAQLGALEGRRGSQGSGAGSGSGRSADQAAQSSGFSSVNSNQSVRVIAPGVPDNFGSGAGPRDRNANETIATALSNANQAVQSTAATQQQQQQQQQQSQPQNFSFDFSGARSAIFRSDSSTSASSASGRTAPSRPSTISTTSTFSARRRPTMARCWPSSTAARSTAPIRTPGTSAAAAVSRPSGSTPRPTAATPRWSATARSSAATCHTGGSQCRPWRWLPVEPRQSGRPAGRWRHAAVRPEQLLGVWHVRGQSIGPAKPGSPATSVAEIQLLDAV
jgi:hypothetical protein